ncbi:Rieske 2Fe-2S domain-containing protein [Oculatella sp. LEGE 06141]|uniref:Rieske (2Fe-2S) protein n=1 Tax=Oculatella sp. LEGE 06141 TaxID=1828648 RepID=UPI00187FA97B|nr:Rieske 2Fe-2S domain-containing protein [Oculatella sp. LEGE 06141]MBE9180402.1 Rieske 2Fe-2S domain-containing protein [Oculatella sp. LEGE 06141]
MVQLVNVAWVDEVAPGEMRAVDVNEQRLILANVEGTFYAIAADCPHRQAPLIQGWLWGHAIECPWHHYRYDLRTGENLYPRNVYPTDLTYLEKDLNPLHCYPVQVEGDAVLVEISGGL